MSDEELRERAHALLKELDRLECSGSFHFWLCDETHAALLRVRDELIEESGLASRLLLAEAAQLRQRVAAESDSHAETAAMFRRVRDERDGLTARVADLERERDAARDALYLVRPHEAPESKSLNRHGYESLIEGDLAWIARVSDQPPGCALERYHIEQVLRWSIEVMYAAPSALRGRQGGMEQDSACDVTCPHAQVPGLFCPACPDKVAAAPDPKEATHG